MKLGMFACKRFQRLVSDSRDRELAGNEEAFLEAHRLDCAACRSSEYESGIALNMLQLCAIEPEIDELSFDTRVIRRLRVQTSRESVRYWSPALVGFAIAGISVLAAMQLVSRSVDLPINNAPMGEAKVYKPQHSFPRLEIDQPKTFLK